MLELVCACFTELRLGQGVDLLTPETNHHCFIKFAHQSVVVPVRLRNLYVLLGSICLAIFMI